METILIFGNDYFSADALHEGLKRMLHLPEYYGKNGDALNDCLSERTNPVNLWIGNRGENDVAETVAMIADIIIDLGGNVKEI